MSNLKVLISHCSPQSHHCHKMKIQITATNVLCSLILPKMEILYYWVNIIKWAVQLYKLQIQDTWLYPNQVPGRSWVWMSPWPDTLRVRDALRAWNRMKKVAEEGAKQGNPERDKDEGYIQCWGERRVSTAYRAQLEIHIPRCACQAQNTVKTHPWRKKCYIISKCSATGLCTHDARLIPERKNDEDEVKNEVCAGDHSSWSARPSSPDV